jgi:two-component system response regulator DegU
MEHTVRVAIADDQPIFRESLRLILGRQPGLKVVAEADDGQSAIEMVELHRPDVVLMDISMPVLNGIEATRTIMSRFPGTKVIILSMHQEQSFSAQTCQAGACQYLCKDCRPQDIFDAILGRHGQNRGN